MVWKAFCQCYSFINLFSMSLRCLLFLKNILNCLCRDVTHTYKIVGVQDSLFKLHWPLLKLLAMLLKSYVSYIRERKREYFEVKIVSAKTPQWVSLSRSPSYWVLRLSSELLNSSDHIVNHNSNYNNRKCCWKIISELQNIVYQQI